MELRDRHSVDRISNSMFFLRRLLFTIEAEDYQEMLTKYYYCPDVSYRLDFLVSMPARSAE